MGHGMCPHAGHACTLRNDGDNIDQAGGCWILCKAQRKESQIRLILMKTLV